MIISAYYPDYLLHFHILSGAAAVLLGTVILILPKVTKIHRWMGLTYNAFIVALCLSSLALLIDLALHKEYLDFIPGDVKIHAYTNFDFASRSSAVLHFRFFLREYIAIILINFLTLYLTISATRIQMKKQKTIINLSFDIGLALIMALIIFSSMVVNAFDIKQISQTTDYINIIAVLFLTPLFIDILGDLHRLLIRKKSLSQSYINFIHARKMTATYMLVIVAFSLRYTGGHLHYFFHLGPMLIWVVVVFLCWLHLKKPFVNHSSEDGYNSN